MPVLPPAARPRAVRHQQRTHLNVQQTANVWQSTGYHRSISGDLMPPETGRVHLVSMGEMGDPVEHFMSELQPTVDANMGRKKSGPFKHRKGASLVMDRSRHTSVRKRHDSLEITVRRGVSTYELDSILARLTAHRLGVHSTWVYLLEGNKRYNLGKLAVIDFAKLHKKLLKLLEKRASIGLHLVDEGSSGAMYKHDLHKYKNVKFARNL